MPMPLQPKPIEDSVVTARYPFLPQANVAIKAHMESNNVNLESLVDTDWLEAVRVRARVRAYARARVGAHARTCVRAYARTGVLARNFV